MVIITANYTGAYILNRIMNSLYEVSDDQISSLSLHKTKLATHTFRRLLYHSTTELRQFKKPVVGDMVFDNFFSSIQYRDCKQQ